MSLNMYSLAKTASSINNSSQRVFSKKNIARIDALFSGSLYMALGAACISDLRMTPGGPVLMIDSGGYPFVFEIGISGVLIATIFRFFKEFPIPRKRQKLLLAGLVLFYAPIFLNFFRTFDISQFIGGGQLRLQLEVWLLGTALILYPLKKQTIYRALTVVVIMAVANSIHAIASFLGLVAPIYKASYRIPGVIRHSGFLEMPGYLGVLCAIAISWALWQGRNKYIRFFILCVCGSAIIIADSRTGMIAVLIAATAGILSISKTPSTINLSIASMFSVLALYATVYLPPSFWADVRPVSIFAAIRIWLEHPLGVPWGSFSQFNPFTGRAVSPHNWPALALLHGGVLSFIAVIFAHIWVLRLWLHYRGILTTDDRFHAALISIMISITVASWFEQVVQKIFAPFIYVTTSAYLAQRYTVQRSKVIKWSKHRERLGMKLCTEQPFKNDKSEIF